MQLMAVLVLARYSSLARGSEALPVVRFIQISEQRCQRFVELGVGPAYNASLTLLIVVKASANHSLLLFWCNLSMWPVKYLFFLKVFLNHTCEPACLPCSLNFRVHTRQLWADWVCVCLGRQFLSSFHLFRFFIQLLIPENCEVHQTCFTCSVHYTLKVLLHFTSAADIFPPAFPAIITLSFLMVPRVAMMVVQQGARETSSALQAVKSLCRCVRD